MFKRCTMGTVRSTNGKYRDRTMVTLGCPVRHVSMDDRIVNGTDRSTKGTHQKGTMGIMRVQLLSHGHVALDHGTF